MYGNYQAINQKEQNIIMKKVANGGMDYIKKYLLSKVNLLVLSVLMIMNPN